MESFFGDLIAGLWTFGLAHPFIGLLAVAGLLGILFEKWRGRGPRDSVRRFSRADKREILARAGGQCEQQGWTGRCSEREGLEADHVHPHSRGGWTNVVNGQALCRRHNKAKRATIPTNGQLRRLAERRAGYFPADVSPLVMRRHPRARPSSARREAIQ